jgi:hypothetical protein
MVAAVLPIGGTARKLGGRALYPSEAVRTRFDGCHLVRDPSAMLAHVPVATITKRIRRSTRASATRRTISRSPSVPGVVSSTQPTPAFNSALP